jgi:hypothetical protein
MLMLDLILIVVIILLTYLCVRKEPYRVCRDCDSTMPDRTIPSGGFSAVNPFIYPYSGAECLEEVQGMVSKHVPLMHAFAPDHVVLTN